MPTFRASLAGGFVFRVGIGASPFLLPLLLQVGFGMNAFASGLTTIAAGIGAITMKLAAAPILRRFGFRRVLIVNAILSSASLAAPALFGADTPTVVMLAVLLVGGFLRSLQFTAVSAVAYADVPTEKLSRATRFAAVLQELSGSVGVALAAIGLELAASALGGPLLSASHFPVVFAVIGLVAVSSAAIFWWQLPVGAGAGLVRGAPASAQGRGP
jgi:MFS family permease